MQAAAANRVASKGTIHDAAERGDLAAVQDFLIADAGLVNEKARVFADTVGTAQSRLLLHALLHLLLISCSFSQTGPLHLAARHGHVEVAQLLLSCNAAVDARDYEYRPYSCIVDKITVLILSFALCL